MLGVLIGAAVASSLIKDTTNIIKDTINEASSRAMKDMIFVNCSASDFYQKQYMEVIYALLGMGFTNVNVVELREHREGFFTRKIYGQVESVSINGKDSFHKGERFAREAYVVVSFHVFKDSPHVVIPELENRNRTQPLYEQTRYQQPINVNVNIDTKPQGYGYQYGQNQYNGNPQYDYNGTPYYEQQRQPVNNVPERRCAYCGLIVPRNAVFCRHCGAPL